MKRNSGALPHSGVNEMQKCYWVALQLMLILRCIDFYVQNEKLLKNTVNRE